MALARQDGPYGRRSRPLFGAGGSYTSTCASTIARVVEVLARVTTPRSVSVPAIVVPIPTAMRAIGGWRRGKSGSGSNRRSYSIRTVVFAFALGTFHVLVRPVVALASPVVIAFSVKVTSVSVATGSVGVSVPPAVPVVVSVPVGAIAGAFSVSPVSAPTPVIGLLALSATLVLVLLPITVPRTRTVGATSAVCLGRLVARAKLEVGY